jgi:tetratricopeptide (TPR) repeat protein
MKYPGLPAVGRDPARPAWNLAGRDLDQAGEQLSRTPERGTVLAVMRFEAARRAGRTADAHRLVADALALAQDEKDRILAHFAAGTLGWHTGETRSAHENYGLVRRYGETAGDRPVALAGRLGLLRSRRLHLDAEGLTDSLGLMEEAEDLGDDDLVADACRESAAWHLMRGQADAAGLYARRAISVHESAGDAYLLGSAEVLAARALNHAGQIEASVVLLRSVRRRALDLRSSDLELQVVTYLGQFLQRGVGPDSPRWAEAREILETALTRSQDPVTQAEILLPLAHLWLSSGRLDDCAEALNRYVLLYASAGGNLIAEANAAKVRARLDLARAQALPYGAFTRPVRLAGAALRTRRLFRQAVSLYRRAGLPTAEASVAWEVDLIDAVTSGSRRSGPPRARSASPDALVQARQAFTDGMRERARGREAASVHHFEVAEQAAVNAQAGLLAIAASGQLAGVAFRTGDRERARRAVQETVQRAERFRGAVDNGAARQRIAAMVRTEYEHAALLAHELDDPSLVLEVAERLRTEQITALLTRRSSVHLPPEITDVLEEIDAVNEELARRETPGGALLIRALPRTSVAGLDEVELQRRLATARRNMSDLTSSAFSEIYDAPPAGLDELVESITVDVIAMLPVGIAGTEQILAVWRGPDGRCASQLTPMTESLIRLRRHLTSPSPLDRIGLTDRDLGPLGTVFPRALVDRLNQSRSVLPLLAIPAGWLWAVPWAATPIDHDGSTTVPLLKRADLTFTPSLRMRRAARRSRSQEPPAEGVVSFALPTMKTADLEALSKLGNRYVSLDGHAAPGTVLLHPQGRAWKLAVVAAHGNREPGLAQALVNDKGVAILAAAHFLTATSNPPRRLVMAACHGLYPPGGDPHEPLGLAVCALAAGVEEVGSSHVEIDFGTDLPSRILADMYRGMDTGETMSRALANAQRRHLGPTSEPLVRWAVMATLGC